MGQIWIEKDKILQMLGIHGLASYLFQDPSAPQPGG